MTANIGANRECLKGIYPTFQKNRCAKLLKIQYKCETTIPFGEYTKGEIPFARGNSS